MVSLKPESSATGAARGQPRAILIGSHHIDLSAPPPASPAVTLPASLHVPPSTDGDSAPASQRASPAPSLAPSVNSSSTPPHGAPTAPSAAAGARGGLPPIGASPAHFPDIFVTHGLVHDVSNFAFAYLNTNMSSPILTGEAEDEHEVVLRRHQASDEREADHSLALRRNRRLASIEGPTFINMMTKAISAKAKKFDLSAAASGLAAAINATGLADPANTPSVDVEALSHIVVQCGATLEDVREIAEVSTNAP